MVRLWNLQFSIFSNSSDAKTRTKLSIGDKLPHTSKNLYNLHTATRQNLAHHVVVRMSKQLGSFIRRHFGNSWVLYFQLSHQRAHGRKQAWLLKHAEFLVTSFRFFLEIQMCITTVIRIKSLLVKCVFPSGLLTPHRGISLIWLPICQHTDLSDKILFCLLKLP